MERGNMSGTAMGKSRRGGLVLVLLGLLLVWLPPLVAADPGPTKGSAVTQVDPHEKCPVCGMFVARYPEWVTQMHLADGQLLFFDGMKDMLAYYFNPGDFGGREGAAVTALWAKDYYTTQWIDARSAYFVTGSEVHGPMGHEFIPVDSEEKAQVFKRDHRGEKILGFEEIDPELVEAMRGAHRMRRQMGDGHQMGSGH